MSLSLEVAGLQQAAPAWLQLADRSARTPFQTYQWAAAWWELVGRLRPDHELHLVQVRRADGPVCALAPLMVRGPGADRELVLATDPFADYLDVLVDDRLADPADVVRLLGQHVREGLGSHWARAVLDEIPPWSPVRAMDAAALGFASKEGSTCPRISLAPAPSGRAEYAVKRRRLDRLGRLECRLHVDGPAIAALMSSFMAMHLRQWVGRPDRGLTFDDAEMIAFYQGMATRLGAAGLLVLAELALDSRPIALYLGFRFRSTFWGYRTTYDVAYSRYSPGHVLHLMLFTVLRDAGFEMFDMMRGDYAYKSDYATATVVNQSLRLERTGGPPP